MRDYKEYEGKTIKELKKIRDKSETEYLKMMDECTKSGLTFDEFTKMVESVREEEYFADKYIRKKMEPTIDYGKEWKGLRMPIEEFIKESNYHGPFSIELLHAIDGNNYFMEMNFRNDGLAYVATCAGANLHALYLNSSYSIDWNKFRPTYMMNYSIDFLYVKKKKITFWRWINDCLKTRCFINLCFSDLAPLIAYYKLKLSRKK